MNFRLFRKSITSITQQFTSMVADLQKLAEQNRTEAGIVRDTAGDLELAAKVKYDRELVVVDGLFAEADALAKEASDAEKLAAKISKTFSI